VEEWALGIWNNVVVTKTEYKEKLKIRFLTLKPSFQHSIIP